MWALIVSEGHGLPGTDRDPEDRGQRGLRRKGGLGANLPRKG